MVALFGTLGFVGLSGIVTARLCPLYGPVFPPVANLSTSSQWHGISAQIEMALDEAFASGNTSHGPVSTNDTYSMQIFSAKDILLEYYNKGPNLVAPEEYGYGVDGDSVYRIASVSKLYAVYLLLIVGGDAVFAEPVTKYLPELKGHMHWDEVNVGDLAGQVGGVAAEVIDVSAVAAYNLALSFPGVFPTLSEDNKSPCRLNETHCSRTDFLETLRRTRFTYLPNSAPAYSNAAFVLIGYIVETITNQTFASALQTSIIEPLGLAHTFASILQDETFGVIIHNATYSGWNIDISEATAMGGIFASVSDVSALGRSILSSRLLPPNTTRAWLKPTSFTSSLIGSVGRPWEIFRATVDKANTHVVDIYTKSGNIGVYASLVALVPDLEIGFTILVASEKGNDPITLAGVVTDILLPALEEDARLAAHSAYAGTYRSRTLNSSIAIGSKKGEPGLVLESWVSNGTDVFPIYGSDPEFRLYPSNVGNARRVSWKLTSEVSLYDDQGAFAACATWVGVDRPTWGLFGLDDWVFVMGDDGRVEKVEIAALEVALERVDE